MGPAVDATPRGARTVRLDTTADKVSDPTVEAVRAIATVEAGGHIVPIEGPSRIELARSHPNGWSGRQSRRWERRG